MEAAGIDVGVSVGEAGASRLLDRNGTPVASGAISPGSDAALAGAWRRYGCQVNPGNPNECPEATATAEIDCAFRERDPGCDGFLPVGRSAREAESQALPPIGSQPIPSLS